MMSRGGGTLDDLRSAAEIQTNKELDELKDIRAELVVKMNK